MSEIKTPIYLDYSATNPMDHRVATKMAEYLTIEGQFGNPASRSHPFGWDAEAAVDTARKQVADLVTRLLGAIDAVIGEQGPVSDGDVMQALAMTLAIRTKMVEAARGPIHRLASELAADSLAAESHSSDDAVH